MNDLIERTVAALREEANHRAEDAAGHVKYGEREVGEAEKARADELFDLADSLANKV